MNRELVLISLLMIFSTLVAKGQNITQDSLTMNEKTNHLPEVIVAGHQRNRNVIFPLNNMEMRLASVKSSDMSFKPIGLLRQLLHLLFPKRKKESRFEKNERILQEYENYLPIKETKEKP